MYQYVITADFFCSLYARVSRALFCEGRMHKFQNLRQNVRETPGLALLALVILVVGWVVVVDPCILGKLFK